MVGGVCARVARLPHTGPYRGRSAASHYRSDGLVHRQRALRKDCRRCETASGCQESRSCVLHAAKERGTAGSACRPGGSASRESSSGRTSQDERAGRRTRARPVTSTRPPARAGEGLTCPMPRRRAHLHHRGDGLLRASLDRIRALCPRNLKCACAGCPSRLRHNETSCA